MDILNPLFRDILRLLATYIGGKWTDDQCPPSPDNRSSFKTLFQPANGIRVHHHYWNFDLSNAHIQFSLLPLSILRKRPRFDNSDCRTMESARVERMLMLIVRRYQCFKGFLAGCLHWVLSRPCWYRVLTRQMERRPTDIACDFEDTGKLTSIKDSREFVYTYNILFINCLNHFHEVSLRNDGVQGFRQRPKSVRCCTDPYILVDVRGHGLCYQISGRLHLVYWLEACPTKHIISLKFAPNSDWPVKIERQEKGPMMTYETRSPWSNKTRNL